MTPAPLTPTCDACGFTIHPSQIYTTRIDHERGALHTHETCPRGRP